MKTIVLILLLFSVSQGNAQYNEGSTVKRDCIVNLSGGTSMIIGSYVARNNVDPWRRTDFYMGQFIVIGVVINIHSLDRLFNVRNRIEDYFYYRHIKYNDPNRYNFMHEQSSL